jgi:hypothetical protein
VSLGPGETLPDAGAEGGAVADAVAVLVAEIELGADDALVAEPESVSEVRVEAAVGDRVPV